MIVAGTGLVVLATFSPLRVSLDIRLTHEHEKKRRRSFRADASFARFP